MDNDQVEKDLDDLETTITLLKREYETFLIGASKLAPLETQRKVERAIKRYASGVGFSYAQRFRYNSLVARFNSYADLWSKQLRNKEEGRSPSGAIAIGAENKTKGAGKKDSSDPLKEKLKRIYEEYLAIREKTGEGKPNVDFEAFCRQVAKQKEAIVSKYQCKDVEFYVKVESGQAKLKARPVK